MVIKKRRNLPTPAPVEIWTEFKPPGRPLEALIKEHDRLASDYDWQGEPDKAAFHQDIANRFRQRLADGELYDVEF